MVTPTCFRSSDRSSGSSIVLGWNYTGEWMHPFCGVCQLGYALQLWPRADVDQHVALPSFSICSGFQQACFLLHVFSAFCIHHPQSTKSINGCAKKQPTETGIGGVGNKKVTSKCDVQVPATGWRGRYFLLMTLGVSSVTSHMITLAVVWTHHRMATSNSSFAVQVTFTHMC
jgi:hypothetical protein